MLIDEFQDTNAIQYAWSLLVAGQDGAPFVVGDDDQSIYRWRGARVENLTRFSKDYPAAKLFRLEQNYRSTGNILKAANALISNNTGRLGKNLWTEGKDGERIKLYAAFNERDEAEFVMHRIREWTNQGGARRDVAILYRIERAVARVRRNLHVGAHAVQGVRRPAVLRARGNQGCAGLPAHHHEPCGRCVVRARGESAHARHRRASRSTWCASRPRRRASRCGTRRRIAIANGVLGPKAEAAVNGFLKLVEQLGRDIAGLELHEQVDHVINNSGLVEHHKKEKARSRRSARREPERTGVGRARLRARWREHGR